MKGNVMKKIFIALGALLTLTGCSTVTHYDAQGNVIKVERVTNFSRVMDGTNAKSQMMLVNGTFVGLKQAPPPETTVRREYRSNMRTAKSLS